MAGESSGACNHPGRTISLRCISLLFNGLRLPKALARAMLEKFCDLFHFGLRNFLSFVIMLRRGIMAMLIVCGFALGETLSLALPESLMVQAEKVTSLTMALRYSEALDVAKKIRSQNDGVGCVLESIVRISMYDDRGDTLALKQAGRSLDKCEADGLWNALRKFELGYVQSESGHSVKGALQTRSAAKLFEESKEQEARAFYAIYAYYVDQSFSWVPFKSDHRDEYLAVLDSASKSSVRFWPLFLTPLIWMHYDKEDFAAGLKLAERGLSKAPNHPVMLQIKADMLYRLKRYDEAARIYERSADDYMKRTGPSIRYWCSVLNLVRIYHDAKNSEKSLEWRKKLENPKYKAMEDWMPGSLMDDLKKKKLL